MEVRKIKWSETAREGYDVTEYFNDGNSAEDFKKLLSEAEKVDLSKIQSSHSSHNSQGSQMKFSSFVPQIDESKLTNALKRFLEAVSETTDAPNEFLLGAQLTLWAGVIGNKIHLDSGNGVIRPNVWLTFFAGSSVARKSTAIDTAALPFKSVQKQLNDDIRGAEQEYLMAHDIWEILEAEARETQPEPRRPAKSLLLLPADFSDAGFYIMLSENPVSGVIVSREFADLHTKLHRNWTGQANALLGAYDNDSMDRVTRKHGIETVEEPTFSILGATTFANFKKVFTSTETENGFLSRVFPIVVSSPTKSRKLLLKRQKSDDEFNDSMKGQIMNWCDYEGDIAAEISDDIEKKFNEWEEKFVEESKSKYGERLYSSIERMVPGALKIAMILQTLEIPDPAEVEKLELSLEILECAQILMEDVFLPSMNYLYDDKIVLTEAEYVESRILSIIKSMGGRIDRSTLRKRSRIDSRILDPILKSMVSRYIIVEEIEHSSRPQGGGNPKTYYRLLDD